MLLTLPSIFLICLLPLPIFGIRKYDKFKEVHEAIDFSSMRISPYDPAINEVPAAPVVPGCIKDGYIKDPFNCAKFYRCQEANAIPVAFYCQQELIFNSETNICEYPASLNC